MGTADWHARQSDYMPDILDEAIGCASRDLPKVFYSNGGGTYDRRASMCNLHAYSTPYAKNQGKSDA